MLSGELNSRLAEVGTQAEAMFFQLVHQLAMQEEIPEQLKAENQMVWVSQMDNTKSRASEIIYSKLTYI